MTGWRTGVRVAAAATGVVVLCACVVSAYLTFRLSLEIRPWSWRIFDLALTLWAALAGAACLKAGITGKGKYIEGLLQRIDAASDAAAQREAQGLERQRRALEHQRQSALEAAKAE